MLCDLNISPRQYRELTIEVWFILNQQHDHDRHSAWLIGHDDGGYDRSFAVSDSRFGGVGQGVGFTYETGIGFPDLNVWHHGISRFAWQTAGGCFVALDGRIGNRVTSQRNGQGGMPQFSIGGLQSEWIILRRHVICSDSSTKDCLGLLK